MRLRRCSSRRWRPWPAAWRRNSSPSTTGPASSAPGSTTAATSRCTSRPATRRVGLFADLARFDGRDSGMLTTDGQFELHADQPVRGVATSGWRGRSFSLGIADSVTVLAATAAQADAAATVIANTVDVADAAIQRLPASACKDDSDLGDTLVTVDVPPLAPA